MTKKSNLYARALVRTLEKALARKQKERIVRLKAILKKRGDLKHLPQILQEFRNLWEQRKGKVARVVSAKTLSPALVRSMNSSLKQKGYQAKEELHEEVVGGVAVFLDNEYLFDNTVKGKLQKIKELLKV